MTKKIRPTKAQQKLLVFLGAFVRQHGYAPSYREIQDGLHYKTVSTVAFHVDNLVEKGLLKKGDYQIRNLQAKGEVAVPLQDFIGDVDSYLDEVGLGKKLLIERGGQVFEVRARVRPSGK